MREKWTKNQELYFDIKYEKDDKKSFCEIQMTDNFISRENFFQNPTFF